MTTNQIEARKLQETIRSNKAKESIDIQKLNETIRNNNLLNKVNITKNEIQALYNDQLNRRQLLDMKSKLDLAYDQLNETAHANDIKVDVEKFKGWLDKDINDARNETSIKTAIISALGRAAGTLGKIFLPSVFTPTSSINNLGTNQKLTTALLTGNVTSLGIFDDPRLRAGTGASDQDIKDAEKQEGQRRSKQDPYYQYQEQIDWYEKELAKERNKNRNSNVQFNERPRINYYNRKRYKEMDEIPEDYSNSSGPGIDTPWLSIPSGTEKSQSRIVRTESPVESGEIQRSVHGTTSGGTDYNISGGLTSKGIIYA